MTPKLLKSVLLHAACLLAACSPAAFAATANKPAAAFDYSSFNTRPDFAGVWENVSGMSLDQPRQSDPKASEGSTYGVPSYGPEYQARRDASLAAEKAGKPLGDGPASCKPPGLGRVLHSPYPVEFIFAPKAMVIYYEYMEQTRRIYTDGRKPPEDLEHSYNGYSTGHWEGDTLVANTVGLRGDTQIQGTRAMYNSDDLTIQERFRLVQPNRMEYDVTFTDPKAMTKPFTVKRFYERRPDWEIKPYSCFDNNRNAAVNGVTATGAAAQNSPYWTL